MVSMSATGVRCDAGDSLIGDSGVVDLLELSADSVKSTNGAEFRRTPTAELVDESVPAGAARVTAGAALGSGSSSVSELLRDARASVKPVVVRPMRCVATLLTIMSRAERTCRYMRLSRRRMFGFSLGHRK